jgi:hypothetical protein
LATLKKVRRNPLAETLGGFCVSCDIFSARIAKPSSATHCTLLLLEGKMANTDHLDTETSASAELTPTGVNAKAKSRCIAAIDRFAGNIFDAANPWLEGVASRKRAKNEGEVKLIEAVARYGVEKLSIDETFAERTFGTHFRKVARAQINKDAVVFEAIENLRNEPPSLEQSESGPDQLTEEFTSRFETYAETATSDELRHRWGRVLASEIRMPGTFSAKTLRTVDELSANTASIFERFCSDRLGLAIIQALSGELSVSDEIALTSSGLIAAPGLGQIRPFSLVTTVGGGALWMAAFDNFGLAFKNKDDVSVDYGDDKKIVLREEKPGFPVYILTEVGYAISSILPHNERNNVARLIEAIRSNIRGGEIGLYAKNADANWILENKL